MTKTETLEDSVRGDLLGAFRQIEPDSIQMAYQICNDMLEELRAGGVLDEQGNVDIENDYQKLCEALDTHTSNLLVNWCGWTGTGAMYTVENGRAVLYLSNDIRHNLVLRPENIVEAVEQLGKTGNYKPSKKDAFDVIQSVSAGTTARIEYDAESLKLGEYIHGSHKHEFSHFVIDTEKYANSVEEGGLNDDQRELAERVWGNGKAYDKDKGFSLEFKHYMAVLNVVGKDTKIFEILNPEYVQKYAQEGAICRVSRLNAVVDDVGFNVIDRFFGDGNDYGILRGVRRKAA